GPRGPQAGLAGTEAADRADPSAPRSLRGAARADPRRRQIRRTGPEQRVQRDRGRAVGRSSSARPRAAPAPSRRRNIAGGGRPAAPHERDLPHARVPRAAGASAAGGALTRPTAGGTV